MPPSYSEAACKWLFEGFRDQNVKHELARTFRGSVALLKREDNSWGNFADWTWHIVSEGEEQHKTWRALIQHKEPSRRVIKSTPLARQHFDRSVGVLNPRLIGDIAECVADVDAQLFWEFYRHKLFADLSQISMLEGKMPVRTAKGCPAALLERHGFLSAACKGLRALLAIGCIQSVDAVPEPYAGSSPQHVARHVQLLQRQGRLQVQRASDADKDRSPVRRLLAGDAGNRSLAGLCRAANCTT